MLEEGASVLQSLGASSHKVYPTIRLTPIILPAIAVTGESSTINGARADHLLPSLRIRQEYFGRSDASKPVPGAVAIKQFCPEMTVPALFELSSIFAWRPTCSLAKGHAERARLRVAKRKPDVSDRN